MVKFVNNKSIMQRLDIKYYKIYKFSKLTFW